MKNHTSPMRVFILATVFFLTGCVHDDEYAEPSLNGQCQEEVYFTNPKQGFEKWTLADLKNKPQNQTFTEDAYITGYVSSTDETGNIFKYLYLQDDPSNPTQGLVISADATNLYTQYPQGSKIYIKLKGLALGTYGSIKQLGSMKGDEFGRIPEKKVLEALVKSCSEKAIMLPKVMTLAEMKTANDQFLGCLIKVPDAEFDAKVLCTTFAPEGGTGEKQINDPTTSLSTRVVRNSGYASFAHQILPAGKGDFIGILSKHGSSYQLFVNRASDVGGMINYPRKDGVAINPCPLTLFDLKTKTIAEIKQIDSKGNYSQMVGDFYVEAQVTANDETGNLYKHFYIEDPTGGIRVNINKLQIYQDERFKVGKTIRVKLKDLFIGKSGGEFQIGLPFNGKIGQIPEAEIYKFFFDSQKPSTSIVATEKTIAQLTPDEVGRWIKIKNVQFAESDLGKTYAAPSATTNLILEDCSGNTIALRTSQFASFAGNTIDPGKGDVYAILGVFNDTYQLYIPHQHHVNFDHVRCDGTLPAYETIFKDGFNNLGHWTPISLSGPQYWGTTPFGNPSPSAIMDGGRMGNEDWLVSQKIKIPNVFKEVFFTFETDARFPGHPLEVHLTDHFTGQVSTTSWTKAQAILDTDLNAFGGFVNSGKIKVTSFRGKDLVVAFRYTSAYGASTIWELDNFWVRGGK